MQEQIATNPSGEALWETPPPRLALAPGVVHVWRAPLSPETARAADLWGHLSEKERQRAAQFHFPDDSDAYVVSHGMLRDILRHYRSEIQGPLHFEQGAKGKPFLAQDCHAPRIQFSLAHTRSMACVAVCFDRELGVDLEQFPAPANWPSLAKQYFAGSEQESLFAHPRPQQERAFLELWTQKEAYLKARGDGLSVPLSSFRMAESANETIVITDPSNFAAPRWLLLKFAAGDAYVGALAVAGEVREVQFWNWKLKGASAVSFLV
jgi:4'-phosphopantetheinyl transferase